MLRGGECFNPKAVVSQFVGPPAPGAAAASPSRVRGGKMTVTTQTARTASRFGYRVKLTSAGD